MKNTTIEIMEFIKIYGDFGNSKEKETYIHISNINYIQIFKSYSDNNCYCVKIIIKDVKDPFYPINTVFDTKDEATIYVEQLLHQIDLKRHMLLNESSLIPGGSQFNRAKKDFEQLTDTDSLDEINN